MPASEKHAELSEVLTMRQQGQQATEGGQGPRMVEVQSHASNTGSPNGSPKKVASRTVAEMQEKESGKRFENADHEAFDDEGEGLQEFIRAEDGSDAESIASCASGDELAGADEELAMPISEDAMDDDFGNRVHEFCHTDGDEENSDDDHVHQHRRESQNQLAKDHDKENDDEEQDDEPISLDDEDEDQSNDFESQQNLRHKPNHKSLESDLNSVENSTAAFPADYESAATADFREVYEAVLESDTLTIEDFTGEEVFDDQLQQLADRKASLEALKSMAMLELQQASEAMVSALQANFNRADDILTQLTATTAAKIDALAILVQKAKLAFTRNRNFEQKCSESLL